MHPCEPFLSGAPQAYFDAPQDAPRTPVEERWSRVVQYLKHFIKFSLFKTRMPSN